MSIAGDVFDSYRGTIVGLYLIWVGGALVLFSLGAVLSAGSALRRRYRKPSAP